MPRFLDQSLAARCKTGVDVDELCWYVGTEGTVLGFVYARPIDGADVLELAVT